MRRSAWWMQSNSPPRRPLSRSFRTSFFIASASVASASILEKKRSIFLCRSFSTSSEPAGASARAVARRRRGAGRRRRILLTATRPPGG